MSVQHSLEKCSICQKDLSPHEAHNYRNKCIFHVDKQSSDHWDGSKESHFKLFWQEIRKQILDDLDKNATLHDFKKYRFPPMEKIDSSEPTEEYDFWIKKDGKIKKFFYLYVDFRGAEFDYDFEFKNVIFNNRACFSNVIFHGEIKFIKVEFKPQNEPLLINFNNTIFHRRTIFDHINFGFAAHFVNSLFNNEASFACITSKELFFKKTNFYSIDLVIGSDSTKVDKLEFYHTSFSQKEKNDSFAINETSFYIRDVDLLAFSDVYFGAFCSLFFSDCKYVGLLNTLFPKETYLLINAKNIEDFSMYTLVGNVNLKLLDCNILNNFDIENCNLSGVEFNGFNLTETKKISFTNVSFLGSHFTNIQWGEVNANRFQIDRQMSRQLKAVNDAQGEIIIANKFYELEMRLHSDELTWKRHHVIDKLVHEIHGYSSDHSKTWILPILWIFTVGFYMTFLVDREFWNSLFLSLVLLTLVTTSMGLLNLILKLNNKIFIAVTFFITSILLFNISDKEIEFFTALINPLNIKNSKDSLENTPLTIVYLTRIIVAFLSYQFITAIRKNTRRK